MSRMNSFAASNSALLQQQGHHDSAALLADASPLQVDRRDWKPQLPRVLQGPSVAKPSNEKVRELKDATKLAQLFPATFGQSLVRIEPAEDQKAWSTHQPLRLGVVLSGGQAPGGHNVIAGLFDYAKQVNPNSQLFGFLNGPHGVFSHEYIEVDNTLMNRYRNQGGFDMICSGRHKIETEDQKAASMEVCKKLDLHGLVVVGGDDSNTNAAILAEYFKAKSCPTRVVGCPKTIDGDLRNAMVEASFGFDTAVKIYSELIGNLCTDVATSQNRFHFVRLMGRSASNIALECALQTRANLTFLGEEVQAKNRSLKSLVDEIAELVTTRMAMGKNYGVILLPEGLIEFIPEMGALIKEINEVLARGDFDPKKLAPESLVIFETLPAAIRQQLLLDRDPHGNVQVAKIATESLLILMAQMELEKRGKDADFHPTPHYFGYEGRCAMPSNFDANYCYALGQTAGSLADSGMTGYMAIVRGLDKPAEQWAPGGCPLVQMMNIERRKGKDVPVIEKYLVELDKPLFQTFAKVREQWKTGDFYRNPGPIQFEGPCADLTNYTITAPTQADLLPPVPFNYEGIKSRFNFVKSEAYLSPLERERLRARVDVAPLLQSARARVNVGPRCPITDAQGQKFVARAFPLQCSKHRLRIYNVSEAPAGWRGAAERKPLKIGVVLQGQQSPGSSNILHGLFERLRLTPGSTLIGFRGITGVLECQYMEISKEDLKLHFNQGGFSMLGRTQETKSSMRTPEGLQKVLNTCKTLDLDGLVMIGGQSSLTDAALVAEHLLQHGLKTCVVGVPATQENNLRHSLVEACIGFDSTSKCYASLIGNLLTDAASATKYWYFVRLMGQVPSHTVLEAALQTHPNVTVISEKYADADQSLEDVVRDIADVICSRADLGKNFGTVLIPEGLTSQLPTLRQMLNEINVLLDTLAEQPGGVTQQDYQKLVAELGELHEAGDEGFRAKLSPWSVAMLKTLPKFFRHQLVRPTHSRRIELSGVSIEQLLSHMVGLELENRQKQGVYKGGFSPVCHYLGFQGRSTIPSNFDCALGYACGHLSSILVEGGLTGCITSVRGLCGEPTQWKMSGVPIAALMKVMPEREARLYGRSIPMVPCAEVDLQARPYTALANAEEEWAMRDCFCNPGPIQFQGKAASFYNRTLYEEQHAYLAMLGEVDSLADHLGSVCTFGIDETLLRTTVLSLRALREILSHQSGMGDRSRTYSE